MAVVLSDVAVCNMALRLLGANAISSLTDATDTAATCNLLYGPLKQSILTAHHWSFATKKVVLQRITTVPKNEYKYEYELPSDRLEGGGLAGYNSNQQYARPFMDWRIMEEQIHTNAELFVLEYMFDIQEPRWPAHFVRLVSHAMASEIAVTTTDSANRADYYDRKAYGTPNENRRGGLFRASANTDSKQQPNKAFENFEVLGAFSSSEFDGC